MEMWFSDKKLSNYETTNLFIEAFFKLLNVLRRRPVTIYGAKLCSGGRDT